MFAEAIKPLVLSSVSAVMAESRTRLQFANREEAEPIAAQISAWVHIWDGLGKEFLYPAFFSKSDIQDVWDYISDNDDFLTMYMSASAQFCFRLTRIDPTETVDKLIGMLRDDLADTLGAFYAVAPTSGKTKDASFGIETGLEERHFTAAAWRQVLIQNPWLIFAVSIYLAAVETTEWTHICMTEAYTGQVIGE